MEPISAHPLVNATDAYNANETSAHKDILCFCILLWVCLALYCIDKTEKLQLPENLGDMLHTW